jgi:hydroxyacylglutathione hydrolase
MPLQIVTVPCLSDNYAFLIHDDASGQTAAVDVPEAAPLAEALGRHGWSLTHILLTHHHWDHVQGVDELKGDRPVAVIGAKADVHRLPPLDLEVAEGDSFQLGNEEVRVIDVSGHTVGHVAYFIPGAKAVFTADSLMALGCGRVFEGTPEMMWQSLSKLAALPGDTVVHSGHEYTETNARFALTIEPGNAALKSRSEDVARKRAAKEPTVPSRLDEELATNPFLRAGLPEVKDAVGMSGAKDAAVFAEIRARKDRF